MRALSIKEAFSRGSDPLKTMDVGMRPVDMAEDFEERLEGSGTDYFAFLVVTTKDVRVMNSGALDLKVGENPSKLFVVRDFPAETKGKWTQYEVLHRVQNVILFVEEDFDVEGMPQGVYHVRMNMKKINNWSDNLITSIEHMMMQDATRIRRVDYNDLLKEFEEFSSANADADVERMQKEIEVLNAQIIQYNKSKIRAENEIKELEAQIERAKKRR